MTHCARVLALTLAAVFACLALSARAQSPPARIVVRDETQLPRSAYPVTVPPSTLLVADDATFAPFAAAVRNDVDRTLRDYDIQDQASLREFLQAKLALQMLAHEYEGARQTIVEIRATQTKADQQLLSDRLPLAYLDAVAQAKASGANELGAAFLEADRKTVDALPWGVVQFSIKESYGGESTLTRDTYIGIVKHNLDPIAAKTGTLDGPAARGLVELRANVLFVAPFLDLDVQTLKAYIAANSVVKPDIWGAREVTLAPGQVKANIRIGIWDSGVDPSDYPNAMYRGGSKQHGLAFADDGGPSSSDLYPLPADVSAKYAQQVAVMSGVSDLQNGIVDSPEAQAAQKYLKSLSPDQEAAFERDSDLIGEYSHGSHVAGIAARGNPRARIVVLRFDDNLPNLPFMPTTQWANKMAANFAAIAAYLRSHHVRVVNASWGDDVSEFEQWLAKTDPNADPQTREQKAQALYAIWRAAIEDVIKNTPGTLFVVAAGNANGNSSFAAFVPASLSYPNLITVGAVNQAGEATSFTSYGPTVAVYADGFHVPSRIPGGYTVKFSGTSMAAPNVTNLAAKLFALDPSLTPVQVRALIVNGATPSEGEKLLLIDPRRSVELLAKMK